ncbi:ComF family protein [Streptomyces sp. NPDC005820]|uniref:ComF family protein n=1 Tax=Streptomyces sp. NPDC005820 TaxID=3157069 RepID=UPI0033CD2223
MEGVRRWWQELAGLVLPAECAGCGRDRTALCPQCRGALHGNPPRRVRPTPEPAGLPAVHAAAPYADEVRAVLLAHKERGGLGLAGVLGVALAGAVGVGLGEAGEGEGPPSPPLSSPPPPLLLVPLPSAPATTRARGHDPARRIALAAAGELRRAGVRARVAPVLRQRRAVADQAGLNARERQDNLVGALAVVPGGGRLLCGGPVVLVDDLMTTGASLAEAARAVRAATAAEPAVVRAALGVTGVPGGEGAPGAARDTGAEGVLEGGRDVSAVYAGAGREGRGVRRSGTREGGGGVRRGGDVLCAAVVAASPDSFGINRN